MPSMSSSPKVPLNFSMVNIQIHDGISIFTMIKAKKVTYLMQPTIRWCKSASRNVTCRPVEGDKYIAVIISKFPGDP